MRIMARVLMGIIIAASASTFAAQSEDKREEKKAENTVKEEKKPVLSETKLGYPELEVTPRASERLDMEAKIENRTSWQTQIPIQFSALMTIIAAGSAQVKSSASSSDQSNFNNTKSISLGVGAGWLVLTGVMSMYYHPYTSGMHEISKMPAATQREELARERVAEEALYAPEDIAIKMKWFSVFSNLAANVALLPQANGGSEAMLVVGALSSFAPILFESHWIKVGDQHRIYKKKIYGPVASTMLLPVNETKYSPGIGLQWTF